MPIGAYISLGALVAGLLGGWTIRDWKSDSDQLAAQNEALKVERQLRDKLGERAGEYEGFRGENEQQGTEVRTKIREIYRNVEVPANCAADPALGVLLDDQIQRANAAVRGQSGSPVQADTPAP